MNNVQTGELNLKLLEAWASWEPSGGCYVLKEDWAVFKAPRRRPLVIESDWNNASVDPNAWKSLHVGLLPTPFVGHIRNAEIYILTLNPGLAEIDYKLEYRNDEYHAALLNNLKQLHTTGVSPFLFLDSRFECSGGFWHWNGKLQEVIGELAKRRGCEYDDARRLLATKLATLELIPYHSRSSSVTSNLPNKLYSSQLAKEFVRQHIVPRVSAGKAIAIVLRGLTHWKEVLPSSSSKSDGLIRYAPKGEARAASLSPSSPGGKAILNWFTRKSVLRTE